jgi:hypothetical protein
VVRRIAAERETAWNMADKASGRKSRKRPIHQQKAQEELP